MHPFLKKLSLFAKKREALIVLAEAEDERVIKAAAIIYKERIANLILLGNEEKIEALKRKLKVKFPFLVIDPKRQYTEFPQKLAKMRNIPLKQAQKLCEDPHYFAAMLVHEEFVDGAISGNLSTTRVTLRAALQVLGKDKKKKSSVFSYFMMLHPKEKSPYFFSDCALNIEPDASMLARIAKGCATEAKRFGTNPKVALLSYSTHGSGKGDAAEKVRLAKKKVREFPCDELQFDAAIISDIAKRKAPKSPVAGNANVFVFPDLMSGNIGYKIAERLGGYHAIGPIIMGLKGPMNDLSRGCSADDIVASVIITILQ